VDVPWKNGMPASALATSSEPFDQLKKATAEAVIPA
jgi:ectoine hydroxylase